MTDHLLIAEIIGTVAVLAASIAAIVVSGREARRAEQDTHNRTGGAA